MVYCPISPGSLTEVTVLITFNTGTIAVNGKADTTLRIQLTARRGPNKLKVCSPEPAGPGASRMNRPTLHCPGPMSRRRFLKLGSLALGGVGLQGLSSLRLEAADGSGAGPDTSVIFVWLPGGPPHMET
jgi:hypothetical protein